MRPDGCVRMSCESIDAFGVQELNLVREQARAEIHACRKEKAEFVAEARTLLSAISEQAATLLASLRIDADQTADRALLSWQKRLADGATAADRLESRIKKVQSDAHSQIQAIGKLGDAVVAELNAKLTAGVNEAHCKASNLSKRLRQSTENGRVQSDSIQKAAAAFTAQIVNRLKETATQSRQVLDEAQAAIASIHDERTAALAELRSAFAPMSERAEHARADLARAADEVRATAPSVIDQVRRAGADVLAEIESARATSTRQNAEQRELLSEICANIEACARRSRAAAQHLAEQTRSAAESTVRRRPSESQAAAQAESDDILHRVKAAGVEVSGLISSLQEGAAQSGRKAAALIELSQKTSLVIRELGTARTVAAREQQSLESANTAAEKTLHLLKYHTQRVGQLVGVIRQLYGALDDRAERIRSRLDAADEICRTVPRELETLRAALAENDAPPAPGSAPDPSRPKPAAPQPPKVVPRAADVKPLPFAKGTLGDIVQRNRKLNAWLHDVINERKEPGPAHEAPASVATRRREIEPVDSAPAAVKNS